MSLPIDISGLRLEETKSVSACEPAPEKASKGIVGFLRGIKDPKQSSPKGRISQQTVEREEIAKIEALLSDSVVGTVGKFLNRHENGKGIWYPSDYCKYLKKEMYPSYFTGYADPEFFEITERFTFQIKEGKKASDAILSFLKGPTVADCGNATTACYYKAILDLIGVDRFNKLFDAGSGFSLMISQKGITDEESPLSLLSVEKESSQKLRIGDECYFRGVEWYANKHPEGFGGGENLIYVGDDSEGRPLFAGHGIEKPLTEEEINQRFIELYNQERTPEDLAYIKAAKTPQFHDVKKNRYLRESYVIAPEKAKKDLKKYVGGFQSNSIRNLDPVLLTKLAQSKDVVQFMKNRRIAAIKSALFG